MGRESWKCPYPNCNQGSSRYWNLMRHIDRLHNGGVIPVKNKSDAKMAAQGKQVNSLATEENKKLRGVKTTREIDLVDTVYQMYRKYRNRNDKIEEMMNYFANKSSSSKMRFSPNFAHYDFSISKAENTVPYNFWSDLTPESIPSASVPSAPTPSAPTPSAPTPSAPTPSTSNMPQADKVKTKMIVGYVEHICNYCLEFEALRMMYDPGASDKISLTRHTCDPDILYKAMAYPTFAREDVLFYRILNSSEQMISAVKEWTKGNVFLISGKLTSSEVPKCTITLNLDLRGNEYNWLTRAIVQKYTILDNKELKEFFTPLERCATFCYVCINFVEKVGQQDVKQEFYYLWLSYRPSLPWEL
jgi:hypothetical protein